jgi:transposase
MEDWVTIKTLKAKNPKMSHREIARLIGISHHTVKSALRSEAPPGYQRKSPANDLLDPFREVIFEMANVKRFRGSRILEELRSKGYSGGKTALYSLLSRLKVETQRTFMPYETLPGEQAQFDWSPYTVLIAGRLVKIFVYSYINGFSRYRVYDAALSDNQGAVFEALENGLIESGGVPQRVQVDNAKVFIHNHSRSNFCWNARYLHFCGHYGFEPSRSLPMHPWSKGKVEKPFDFLETHFIAGASFESFPDLLVKLKAFQTRVNARPHATIKTTPEALVGKDREAFSKLPSTRYVGVKEETRKVTFDCLLSYGGSRYSVPWPFAGKHVWIRLSKGFYLEVYSQANAMIAVHPVSMARGAVVLEKSHYRTPVSVLASIDRLKLRFRERFPQYEMFLEKLLAQKRMNARYHLHEILELARLYHTTDFENALGVSLQYNVFTVHFLSGYLAKNFQQSFDLAPRSILRTELLTMPEPVTRDLTDYRLFGEPQTPSPESIQAPDLNNLS